MTTDAWVQAHPFLEGVARLEAEIESAASAIDVVEARLPRWDDYAADFLDGVPLLHSEGAAIDLEPVEEMTRALAGKLAARPLPAGLVEEAALLFSEPRENGEVSRRVAEWLFGDAAAPATAPGLARYLAWTAAARYLRPVVKAFEGWREEERWLRNFCPTCGSAPAMAQLLGADPARVRLLVCGRCKTRWRYRRTNCAFCDDDAQSLTVLAIEGEQRLRIDFCEACRGYLKAYVGEGEERVFLSDWTSLHLDVLAIDRGLKRMAASLYELPSAPDLRASRM